MVTVGEVMTRRFQAVEPATTSLTAWEFMRRSGVEHLAVVGRSGRIHGIVSRSDIAVAQSEESVRVLRRTLGEMLFGKASPRVSPKTPIGLAAQVMFDAHCDALSVVNSSGRLVGLVTDRDVLAAVAGRQQARATERAVPPLRPWTVTDIEPVS
ncbi:CBS domain-containing protein [Haloactinopolyspora sp.]|uniref:CBS domain-containing protein n=1 Tax=Haloactinopolyspora sp. TaxID=1966353 RepID=UPI002605421F|nr:CBS domain-containing protein [Haloactinopolyspora sp.]